MTDDRADDEAAILEILHAQRIAFWTKDFEGYQRCFAHEPYFTPGLFNALFFRFDRVV